MVSDRPMDSGDGTVACNGGGGQGADVPELPFGRTPWQMHMGLPVKMLDVNLSSPGALDNYQWADIPMADDTGWGAAPDPEIIGFGGPGTSEIPGENWRDNCMKAVNYTYF
ncbi:hypothetical protein SAMN06265173_1109 [Thalassovita litoralis]|uniref:Uncharacterized protein n=1 Tax=Thalassovita litoralis TaxID=1010611 RepID=A0A521DBC3_9RHOB|nr:hypothetical protein [Thalassovita litoralis]SMO68912.1 hypothetical protein SAMN06265173_1109 [Thalassovita litoralis]